MPRRSGALSMIWISSLKSKSSDAMGNKSSTFTVSRVCKNVGGPLFFSEKKPLMVKELRR